MEAATDAVVAADQGGRITYVNPSAEKMFGYVAAEMLGTPLSELVPERLLPVYSRDVIEQLARGEAGGAGKNREIVGIRRDGTEFPVELSVSTWFAAGEQYFAGILRDITDRKKVEAQLLVADRMVAVGTLAAGVAHEINNPLAAVMANLDLAIQDLADLSPEIASRSTLSSLNEELRDARDAADRVRHIVRDLKIFSRGEDEVHGPVDVRRVMESAIRMAWNEIRHRARLVKSYGILPAVEASEARLGQVFLNLLINAAQAIPEGQVDANEIRVTTRADGDRVVVEIADTGPGIPPEVLQRLFSPFVTTKPVGVGTGLGLSICHRIVTGFGGEIAVSNPPGGGAVFTISLPCASTEVEVSRPPALRSGSAARRGKILVVDDEPTIAQAVKRTLAADHEVIAYQRAGEALDRIIAGERFDVILCDLMMPEMTGMEFHHELARSVPEQAALVVFLTGGAFTARARSFLDVIPNQRIEKPFDVMHLRALVNDRIR
jgi:PAS domain S-box-containing protein